MSFESSSTDTEFNYKITVFGDLIPTSCPKTIEEFISMLPSISAGLQKTNGGKGRPLEYIMLPIGDLATVLNEDLAPHRYFRAVEENITQEIHSIFDELDKLRTTIHTMTVAMRKCDDFFLEKELTEMNEFETSLLRAERHIRSRLAKMLIQVRSVQNEANELDQLLTEIEREMVEWKSKVKEIQRGKLHQKTKFVGELKEKKVVPVREPESLAVLHYRYPKHELIVLYTSDELRSAAPELWIDVFYEFLHRILFPDKSTAKRLLFAFFDFDLNPNFQPQQKKLEVKTYVGKPLLGVGPPPTIVVTEDGLPKWQNNAKERLNEMFGKSLSRILTRYAPSFAQRSEIFARLRRNQINVLLIGRTQIGKSTMKSLLTDPTSMDEVTRSEFPSFEQFAVTGTDVIMNFIDTPGLFQNRAMNSSLPDNNTLIHLIDSYVRSKVEQLHFVCFCMSISSEICNEDLEVIKVFFNLLGPEMRKNACLIVTHCETKSDDERAEFLELTKRNLDLKLLSSQLKQGVFFSGAIDRTDWTNSSEAVFSQFQTLLNYRKELLDLFVNASVNPLDVAANMLSKKVRDEVSRRQKKGRK